MFSTINFRNEKKQHQKSQEEHKRIFFSLKMLLATNNVILSVIVFEAW